MARSCLVCRASLTSDGRSSAAGACVLWKESGTPSGRTTQSESTEISTFNKSEMGPSSSTFQCVARSEVKRSYRDPGPS
eukprot:5483361-Pleurochrysis_carterae.AAC.1